MNRIIKLCENALGNCDEFSFEIKSDYSFGKGCRVRIQNDEDVISQIIPVEEFSNFGFIFAVLLDEMNKTQQDHLKKCLSGHEYDTRGKRL